MRIDLVRYRFKASRKKKKLMRSEIQFFFLIWTSTTGHSCEREEKEEEILILISSFIVSILDTASERERESGVQTWWRAWNSGRSVSIITSINFIPPLFLCFYRMRKKIFSWIGKKRRVEERARRWKKSIEKGSITFWKWRRNFIEEELAGGEIRTKKIELIFNVLLFHD